MQCDRYISLPNRDYMFLRTVFSSSSSSSSTTSSFSSFLFIFISNISNDWQSFGHNKRKSKSLKIFKCFRSVFSVHFVWFVIVVCWKEQNERGREEYDELIFSNTQWWVEWQHVHTHRDSLKIECPSPMPSFFHVHAHVWNAKTLL